MRRFLLILMLALLPLRGWMGDVMAMEMAQQAVSPASIATYSIANSHHSTPGIDRFDTPDVQPAHGVHPCPDHAAAPSGDGSHEDLQASTSTECNTCTTCQVCHSVAVAMAAPVPAALAKAATAPLTPAPAFTSVVAARGFKPPIS
jgi:hypothetical protein